MNVEEMLTCSGPAGYHPDNNNNPEQRPKNKIPKKILSRDDGGVFRDASPPAKTTTTSNQGKSKNNANNNNMFDVSQHYYGGNNNSPNRVTSLLHLDTTSDDEDFDGSTIDSTTVGGESTFQSVNHDAHYYSHNNNNNNADADTAVPSQEGEEAVVAIVDPTETASSSYQLNEDRRYSVKRSQRSSRRASRATTTNSSTNNNTSNNRRQDENNNNNNNGGNRRYYSISQLVECLGSGQDVSSLPPELERRVLDFRLAQRKRIDKHGMTQRWGIFGMYAHLANVRTDLEWAEDAAWRRANDEPYLSWSDFDECRTKGLNNRPWFTYFLIALCSLMLFVEFGVNGWKVEPLYVNPLIGPSAQTLINVGARETTLIVQEGQWFRLFSPLILHAGLIHYVINMGALYFIGGAVEQSHGIISAFLLFFIPGVGGNILSAVFLPQYISVGASGGIFGLIGGCLADITMNWSLLFIKDSEHDQMTRKRNAWAIFWIVIEVVVNIVLGLTPYIDNFTHLGGLLYGLCCGWSTIEHAAAGFFGYKVGLCAKIRANMIRFFGFIVSIVFIMITTAWLATSDAGEVPCPNCRYVSCVPFPWWTEDKWWYCDDCDFVQAILYRTENVTSYTRIDLTCPDKSIENIDVLQDEISTHDEMRQALPGYCRAYCEEVFARN
jgi:membrane associated rhomboid family serine protease